ncbi:sensor histidine kinase [Algoriphagus machipongonensis]|nr:histidine kinase [Algoriphagus machipongonensis]
MKKGLFYTLIQKLAKELALCLGSLLFFTFYFGITISNLGPSMTFGLFLLPITIALIHVFSFFLIPEYLFKQRYLWFGIYTLYTIIISIFLITLSSFYGFIFINSLETFNSDFLLTKNLYLIIIGVYMLVLLTSLFSAYRESYKMHLRNQDLQFALLNGELQLKQEELSYLKMQIHPHFLFNTLNTIYGSAIAKKQETPELILKLSNLLDYILYQTKKSLVPLQDEIEHLQDYLALEKLRHGSSLKIHTSLPENRKDIKIAPMLFLPLLENSFKHGKTNLGNAFVDLRIEVKGDLISFSLKNSKAEKAANSNIQSSGIGLQNIKKRLILLYPNTHSFQIEDEEEFFLVKLEIQTKTA